MASPAPTSSSPRSGAQTEDQDDVVPITRDKLRYFRAKKDRWNAAQPLRQRPLLALASSPPTPPSSSSPAAEHRGGRNNVSIEVDKFANVIVVSPPPYRQQEQERQQPPSTTTTNGNNSNVGASSPSSQLSHRDQVVQFYAKHNPNKIDGVDHLLEKYQGRELQLLQKFKDKYEGLNTSNTGASSISSSKYPLPPPIGAKLRCFFRFSSHPTERVVVELFDNAVPVTCENFRVLCRRPPAPVGYKQSVVHRIVPNFCVQMGDYTAGNGTGGRSIYKTNGDDMAAQHGIKADMWGNFHDEAFLQHSEPGLLSMANNGPNKNSSQFFVTLKALPHLDGKHVVFGRVLEGFQSVIVNLAQNTVTDDKQRPLVEMIRIVDCGQLVDGTEVRHEDEQEKEEAFATAVSSNDRHGGGTTSIPSTKNHPIGGFSFGSASVASPFGAAFGFGSTATAAPAGATLSSSVMTPFSFAALSEAIANTSCDAFSSIRAVTTGDGMDVQAAASAAFGGTPRMGTLHENDSPSVATTTAEGWHPVSSFALRAHPPRGPTASAPEEEDAAAAAAAALRHTPSVPFSFSPSSTITTVDPFTFSFASSSSTVEDRMPTSRVVGASVATSSGRPTGHLDSDVDEDADDDEYDPDDDEEEYDSDETPTSCSEASDDDDDDAAETDTFRMQATLESTFSSTVSPPPQAPTTFANFGLAARGPAPTFSSVASPTALGGASALIITGIRPGTTATTGDAPADQSSPLGAVNVNHAQTKTTVQISSGVTASADANGPAKSTPSGKRHGFGFGFGSTVTDFSPGGFGSVAGAPLSFAGLAASGTATPVFAATTAFSTDNDFAAKASDFPLQPTPRDKSSASLSFTAFRLASNQTGAAGRGGTTVDDDSDYCDHEEVSSKSSSSRSESPPGDSLRQVDHESSVTELMNTGCISAAPTRDSQEAIDAIHKAPTDSDRSQIANIVVLSGVDSNDDLTSPLDLVSTTSGDVPESKQAIQATCEPPNAYSISFSSYGSVTFVDPTPSQDEVPSPCNSPTPDAHLQSLLDCNTETMDVPTGSLNETEEAEIEDEPPEVAVAEPSGATCGLCWCLKSDTIETSNPSITDESDIMATQPIQGVNAAAVEAPKGDHVESLEGQAKLQIGSKPSPVAIPHVTTDKHKPVASPLSPGQPFPTMSTDSEKEYVPESLRRFVAEASNALAEGHKSFLTCVKEDHPLPDEPIVPLDKVVERPPSAAALGCDAKGEVDVHGHSVESAVPGEVLLVGAPSSLANSMLYLQPFLLSLEPPRAHTRPAVTETSRFQVLGEGSLPTKSRKSGVKLVDVPARVPFVPISSMPSPHEASLDMTYTAILVRYRAAPARRVKVKALNQPMNNARTADTSGTVDSDRPTLEDAPKDVVSSAPTSSQVPYYFGSSGPAASAFYFGGSNTTGSWHTAAAAADGSATSSPLPSTASAVSPGLVGATCSSSSSTSLFPPTGAASSYGCGGDQSTATTTSFLFGAGAGAAPPPAAPCTNAFVFGSDILPVVFNFEDRDAREATYARYGTAVGTSEVVAPAPAMAAPSNDGPTSAPTHGEKEGLR